MSDLPRADHVTPDRITPEPQPTPESEPGHSPPARQQDKADDKKPAGQTPDKPKSRLPLIILAIVVVLVIIGGVVYWLATRDFEDTDDAYTEGRAVSIAPKISGYVTGLNVDDNTFVHAGDLLLTIDQRDYLSARDQARANLDLANAQLQAAQVDLEIAKVRGPAQLDQADAQVAQALASQHQAQRDFRRQQGVDPRATTQTAVDQASSALETQNAQVKAAQAQREVAALVPQTIAAAEAAVKQRQAQVEQAQAALKQAETNLSYTEIRAPEDGRITRRNVERGTFAQAGQQVFYLVTPDTWIIANFKENQLADMRPNQRVTITVDAYPTLDLRGYVQSIQAGSGARFTTFPAENATGNFVKIVRRVPVKIVIDGGLPPNTSLPLGISVDPSVRVR